MMADVEFNFSEEVRLFAKEEGIELTEEQVFAMANRLLDYYLDQPQSTFEFLRDALDSMETES